MPELPTFDELYAHAKSECQSRNTRLTDFNDGSDLDALTGSGAVLADEAIAVLLDLFAAQFIDTAEGAELDALASDRFGLVRNPAAAAVGVVRFTRSSSLIDLSIPAGTRVQADVDGELVTATTDANESMLAASNWVDVTCTVTETGRDGNVAAGEFDTLLDAIVGDTGVTVTNADRFAGGASEETDAAFRDRIRRYFQTLRKGTLAALETGALSVAGVQFASVDESYIDPDDGGYVAVYVGDPDGAGNATLAALVEAELENWRCAGVEVRVYASAREEIATAYTVTVLKGSDQAALTTALRAAIIDHFDALAPNETHYASKGEAAAHNVDKLRVRGVQQTTPATATSTPSSPQNALRTTEAMLTLTFVEV